MIFCTLFTALGQIFFKYGSQNFSLSVSGILLNYHLLGGFFFYGVGSLLLIIALRYGDLSLLYPFVSLTFLWVLIISTIIFHETLNEFKIAAFIMIIYGVIFISGGS